MNIFVLHENPRTAARMMCDKHIPKMVVESAQMLASALRVHGATDEQMPLTQAGKPYKGGYHNHPCTRWATMTQMNYLWLMYHGRQLCVEYFMRFGKIHACQQAIEIMSQENMIDMIPIGRLTTFARAFNKDRYPYLYDEKKYTAVEAYRAYYYLDKARFAKWEKGTPAPQWWEQTKVKQ